MRARIESERVGLPAPVVTPYLVGLLVMLGLLGTFVGMVDTLHGAVFALEGTTELQAIRAGLTAPIQGLSVAFGTSVAGVSASAMLGLISTLSRRDRMIATKRLDTAIATDFREYSLAYNRQLSFQATQTQAGALPDVAERLNTLADKLEHMGEALGDKLISNQDRFHDSVNRAYVDLATSVDNTLKESLAESGRQAGDSIRPVLEEAMIGISRQSDTISVARRLDEIGPSGANFRYSLQHSATQALDFPYRRLRVRGFKSPLSHSHSSLVSTTSEVPRIRTHHVPPGRARRSTIRSGASGILRSFRHGAKYQRPAMGRRSDIRTETRNRIRLVS